MTVFSVKCHFVLEKRLFTGGNNIDFFTPKSFLFKDEKGPFSLKRAILLEKKRSFTQGQNIAIYAEMNPF